MQNRSPQDTTPARRDGYPGSPAHHPVHWYRPMWWQALGVLLVATVGVLSLLPSPPEPPRLLRWDKAQHLLAYLVLAWWWVQCRPRRALVVVAVMALYGLALEGLQALAPARMLELGDMLANALGAGLGGLLARTPAGRVLYRLDRLLAPRERS